MLAKDDVRTTDGITHENKQILQNSDQDAVFSQLKKGLYKEKRDMVRKASLNILKEFWRYYETTDKGCQTSDDYIEQMKQQAQANELTIVKYRTSLKKRNEDCEALQKWNEKIKQELFTNIAEFEEFTKQKSEYQQQLRDLSYQFE